jgi:hypothetical protein
MAIQARIPTALCAIHNFIHTHDAAEGELQGDVAPLFNDSRDENYPRSATDIIEHPESSDNRDRIASLMWEDYQRLRRDIAAEQEDDEDEGEGSEDEENEEENGLGSEFDDLDNTHDEFEDYDSEYQIAFCKVVRQVHNTYLLARSFLISLLTHSICAIIIFVTLHFLNLFYSLCLFLCLIHMFLNFPNFY